jgi:serine O-acetyltransferase
MTAPKLADYLETQLNHFFPDQVPVRSQIDLCLDDALMRLEACINRVKFWEPGVFDYLQSTQYSIFLYFLSNTIWRLHGNESGVCTKLFLLNKTLNGIDCFYEIQMPNVFFIGHTVGIVLAKATYGEHLVLYQNSTVGKNHGISPVIDEGVIMYPNTAIIGRCHVASGSVIGQGVSVINKNTQKDSLVFQDTNGGLIFKSSNRDILGDFFR